MAEWVSFQELKERVSLTDVLEHHGLAGKAEQYS